MATVLLAGAYGQRNLGDDALLTAFGRALCDHRVIATSAEPELTRSTHDCDVVSSLDRAAILGALVQADAVVLGGGTVFKALHPSTGRAPHELLRNASLLALAARAMSKPVLLVGVGAAPLRTARERRLARRLVRRSGLLVLRDDESARVLADAGAPAPFRVGADATWASVVHSPLVAAPVEDVVLVAVSRFAGSRDLTVGLAEGLRQLRAEGLTICLQPWQVDESAPDDLPLTHALASEIGGPVELRDPPTDLFDAVRQAAAARLVVAMRFHALVAAAVGGTRTVAVDHEPKLGALARRLGQVSRRPHPGVRWATVLSEALDGPVPDSAAIAEQAALATEGFRLLRLVLGGGGTPEATQLTGLPLEPRVEQTA
jgi:polysaccharide pyruvyl transferase WcaK-like protein